MRRRRGLSFQTVRSEGAILPADLLEGLTSGKDSLDGLTRSSYHLTAGEKINEAVNRSWQRHLASWRAFRTAAAKLSETEPGTSLTREKWLLPLFQDLGYGRLQASKAVALDGKSYPISHSWGVTPIHLVGFRVDLDRRTRGVAGAARESPHSLVQEFLNRSDDHLWGIVSNGHSLRILRDNSSLTRQAFVEFDLESMFEGEVFSDFVLLWLLCHQSRVEGERPEDCWLERWSKEARTRGTRALDRLRDGVEQAINALARGFLAYRGNGELRERLRSGDLGAQDYYRTLLRVVYRLIFLFVAEDRELLLDPAATDEARERYRFYSTSKLRELAASLRGGRHADRWRGLWVVMEALGQDEGCAALGLPALGSFLWSSSAVSALGNADVANRDLLEGIRALAFTSEDGVLRPVDFKNLGSQELGSIYESLLELHPEIHAEAGTFELKTASGHERKTTGSYYTPESLIQCLLDSALDPVLEEAASKPDPEKTILDLKVCDPACGSGHFLIAAAHRIAKRLASVRTGDDEPPPEETRRALRDVIGRCLHGVDTNPMAVELCKVSLWMEALEPGKPLSFLENKILCGNSLLGTTPALLERGIPDDAFKPIEGDDKKVASAVRKENREFRKQWEAREKAGSGQQGEFEFVPEPASGKRRIEELAERLNAIGDSSIAAIHEKEAGYRKLAQSEEYRREKLLTDAWCSAFVWKLVPGMPEPPTQRVFEHLKSGGKAVSQATIEGVEEIAGQYQWFHWHLAFPDVFRKFVNVGDHTEERRTGWTGGFEVVLGNPPWDRLKLQEAEWFATTRPDITNARTAASRRRKIEALAEGEDGDRLLYDAFLESRRQTEGTAHFVRSSGRFPFCGRGDVNTYSIFAEMNRDLLAPEGRVGCIVPSGIATDDTTKHFFRNLCDESTLCSLLDFENSANLFPGVGHGRARFCLLVIRGTGDASIGAEMAFLLRTVADVRDPQRRFVLKPEDIELVNPNTRTCPVFRSRHDAEITKAVYRHVPVLIREAPEQNPWGITFLRMFDMANDSELFRRRTELEKSAWRLEGNVFKKNGDLCLPLYEAKMADFFNHRAGDYAEYPEEARTTILPSVLHERLLDPEYFVKPRYWVPEESVRQRLEGRWHRRWLIGWRDVTHATNWRSSTAVILPYCAVGHTNPLAFPSDSAVDSVALFLGAFNSFVFDYVSRQKIGGLHLTYHLLKQLPVFPPEFGETLPSWSRETVNHWLSSRVLELVYTAWDLEEFAEDCGHSGPPFRWNPDRRLVLRCEIDAAMFHLYSLGRNDVEYVMETFPIVKRKDQQAHGDYRTKRMILEIYDDMRRAIETGEPYQTRLDPPPADPRVAHPPRETSPTAVTVSGADAAFFQCVDPAEKDKYATCVPLFTLKAAAGHFGDGQSVEPDGWVSPRTNRKVTAGMFVAQVTGRSMEPKIHDGSWCLFVSPVTGTRQGKIVLVQHHDIHDPETGGSYTVKRYESKKTSDENGAWAHSKIRLEPLNPEYDLIEIGAAEAEGVKVIAELVEVLGTLTEPTEG